MVSNEKIMLMVLTSFDVARESRNNMSHSHPRQLSPGERARFIKAYYRSITLATIAGGQDWHKRIAHLTCPEFFNVCEIYTFLQRSNVPRPMLKVCPVVAENEDVDELINDMVPYECTESLASRSTARWILMRDLLCRMAGYLYRLPANVDMRAHYEDSKPRYRYPFTVDSEWMESQEGSPLLTELWDLDEEE